MKKLLKIVLITFVLILALLLVIPFAFKGRIMTIAQNEINKNLNAKVEFSNIRLSLIRNFPNLCVSLIDMSVVGLDDFENDTLVSFSALRTVVDIKSVIRGPAMQVRSIMLDQPRVKARVLEDGRANWDIMIETEDVEDTEPGEFQVELQRFEVRNGRIEYDDEPFDVRTTIEGLNLVMSGDLTQDLTSLDISATSDVFNFWFNGVRYINNAHLSVNTLLDANLNDFKFTFMDNEIMLNELIMGIEGFFAMPESDIDMDLAFFSKKTDFKTILSLVPAIYMADFEDLTASGYLTLEGFARGTLTDITMPSVGMDLIVEDGGFSYPDLPKSLDNLHMNLNLFYDGIDEDLTTVDLHSFHMEMAGNPFDMRMKIRTPVSDMSIDAAANGIIDFTSLADVIPLDDVTIRGLLESELLIDGYLSDLENGRYEYFNAEGNIRLTAFQYSGPDFPLGVNIQQAMLDFSPRYVELSDFESLIGKSDFRMSGRMENFIPYFFSDGTVRGNLLFSSTLLDLNELISGLPEEEAVADTVPLSIVEIPGNINFTFASSIESILFDDMEISDLKGRVTVRDNKVMMENVNMRLLEGSLGMKGEYNTVDMSAPFIDFAMDINNFDIPASFHTFNTVQQLTPIAGNLQGSYSTSMRMYALLDEGMMPVLNSINAHGRLQTSEIEVLRSETLDKLFQALRLREDRQMVLDDADISFTILDGRVHVEPFNTRLGPVNMRIGGDQGIDQTMNYVARMEIPRSAFGPDANQVINDLASIAAERGLDIKPGDIINVDARITGTFSDPQISLDMREGARATMDEVRDQIRSQAAEEIEKRVDQAEERVREEAAKRAEEIIKEAERRADQVKKAAREAGAKIIKEGEAAATKIEEEASGRGRLAEAAAKQAADRVRREAGEKADALIRDADERADKIIEDAKKDAEKIR